MFGMDSTVSVSQVSSNHDASSGDGPAAHGQKVLGLMNEYRKVSGKLCDVVLEAGDVKVPAHRSVLAACSPYFFAMFTGDLIESKQKHVHLKDVKADVLIPLVEFAYTGKLEINVENVQPILALSSLLQFSEAQEMCCKFLEDQLDPSNCLGIRRFVEDHGCHSFLAVIDKFVLEHFTYIVHSEEYTMLPHDLLEKVIRSDNLRVDKEEEVYVGIMKWVKHDVKNRAQFLTKLLTQVRLPLISVSYLLKEVDNEHLIRQNISCRDILDEAKNYHLQPERHTLLRSTRTKPRNSTMGILYAVGGKEAGETITPKVECYSMQKDKWTSVAALNTPRQQLGVSELRGRIYAAGGSDGYVRLDSVEVFSTETKKWTYAKPLNVCRSGIGLSALGGTLYALGGYDGRLCLNSVERYDPEIDTWHMVAPTNVTRSFPGVAVLNNRLFVVGGNDGSAFLTSCEMYDPLTNRWSYVAPMSRARAGVGCDVMDGRLYVAGGFDGVSRLDSVDMFEPRMNAWIQLSPMNSCRDGVCMRKYGCWLFAVGGIDGPSYLNSVERYDPVQDKWEDVVSMETSRAAAGVAILPASTIL